MIRNFIFKTQFGKIEKTGYLSFLVSAILIFWLLGLFLCSSPACAQEVSFREAISPIRSPMSLASWLSHNFSYEFSITHLWQTPEQTFTAKKGSCKDFALLAQNILRRMNIPSEIVIIKFRGLSLSHAVCIFREADGTYSFISNCELCRSGKPTTTEALKKFYPDLESITPFSKLSPK